MTETEPTGVPGLEPAEPQADPSKMMPAHTPADQPNAYGPAVTPVAEAANPVVSVTITDNGHAGFQIDSTLDGEVQPTMTFPESHGLVLATISTVEDWLDKLSTRYADMVPPEPVDPGGEPAPETAPPGTWRKKRKWGGS